MTLFPFRDGLIATRSLITKVTSSKNGVPKMTSNGTNELTWAVISHHDLGLRSVASLNRTSPSVVVIWLELDLYRMDLVLSMVSSNKLATSSETRLSVAPESRIGKIFTGVIRVPLGRSSLGFAWAANDSKFGDGWRPTAEPKKCSSVGSASQNW